MSQTIPNEAGARVKFKVAQAKYTTSFPAQSILSAHKYTQVESKEGG